MRDERVEEEGGEPSSAESADSRGLGGLWHSSWGLRLSLGLVAVLVWVGATSVSSSPSPTTGSPVSPPVTTPVMAPSNPPPTAPSPANPATVTPNLPQQTLDITYDYGPGPQPVPGQSPTP